MKIIEDYIFWFVVPFVIAMMLIVAWPFMWLWNYAVVEAVTVTKEIDYWRAFWLMVFLSVFLFSGKSSK